MCGWRRPFVLLALFPALFQSLPRSGNWMGALTVVLGLVELGAALKFLSNADLVWRWGLLHREVVLALWVALALLAALYLLRQIRLSADLRPIGE
jgi:thiol:disulfide interchange protein